MKLVRTAAILIAAMAVRGSHSAAQPTRTPVQQPADSLRLSRRQAIAEALQKQIEAATAESAREAEAEWSGARRSPRLVRPTTGASVSLRPIAEGIEITVRYVTRVTDRDELRGKLYSTAVEMVGEGTMVDSPATATGLHR